MSIYTREELQGLGLGGYGEDVRISRRASLYGASRIVLGDHVRIDDFCVLSAGDGGIEIGSYIHIAVYSSLIGAGRITVHDFANISSRVSIYSSSDDYSGETMTNPMVPDAYKRVDHAPVVIGRHVIIGSGSIVLPGVTLHEGVAVGALSMVNRDIDPFMICAGVPAKPVKPRSRALLAHEQSLLANLPLAE